jgi:methylmalonyl-CoA decarboxylase
MALVSVTEDGNVGTVTLDHPGKRNALGKAVIDELVRALDRLEARGARAVVLRAAPGVKVWSAGYDIDELPTTRRDPLGWSEPLRVLVRRLLEFQAPVIALLEGGVWGGACEVAFACDLIHATPDVTFAITPARLGVPYGLLDLKTLADTIPRAVLKELVFTGRPMGVERAWQLGAVNHVVPAERISAFTREVACTIAANAPLTISAMKEQLHMLDDAFGLSDSQFERLQELRGQIGASRDYREGLAAFAEKRPPLFLGS